MKTSGGLLHYLENAPIEDSILNVSDDDWKEFINQCFQPPEEGTTGIYQGRNIVFRNGKWQYERISP